MHKETWPQTQLTQAGYTVLPHILGDTMLGLLRDRFDPTYVLQYPQNLSDSGSLVALDIYDPLTAALLSWPPALGALAALGYSKPKLHSFYVSAKFPGARPLHWHRDVSYEWSSITPPEVFLIYYLDDTTRANGCLRVKPGSHVSPSAHREVDVPVRAGDLFIGDRRLLHATHANGEPSWRICLTVAYIIDFNQLPAAIQRLAISNPCLASSWDGVPGRLKQLLPGRNVDRS